MLTSGRVPMSFSIAAAKRNGMLEFDCVETDDGAGDDGLESGPGPRSRGAPSAGVAVSTSVCDMGIGGTVSTVTGTVPLSITFESKRLFNDKTIHSEIGDSYKSIGRKTAFKPSLR